MLSVKCWTFLLLHASWMIPFIFLEFFNRPNIIMYASSTVLHLELIIASLTANSTRWLAQWIFTRQALSSAILFINPVFLPKLTLAPSLVHLTTLNLFPSLGKLSGPFFANMMSIPSFKASAPVPPIVAMCNNEANKYVGVPGCNKENVILPLVNLFKTISFRII